MGHCEDGTLRGFVSEAAASAAERAPLRKVNLGAEWGERTSNCVYRVVCAILPGSQQLQQRNLRMGCAMHCCQQVRQPLLPHSSYR